MVLSILDTSGCRPTSWHLVGAVSYPTDACTTWIPQLQKSTHPCSIISLIRSVSADNIEIRLTVINRLRIPVTGCHYESRFTSPGFESPREQMPSCHGADNPSIIFLALFMERDRAIFHLPNPASQYQGQSAVAWMNDSTHLSQISQFRDTCLGCRSQ